MATQFSGDDMFDSRDIQDRINELQDAFDIWKDENPDSDVEDFEDYDELTILNNFKDEVDNNEWEYGIGFINDQYFENHAEDFAVDCGYINKDSTMYQFIDWSGFAEWIQQDYTAIVFDNVTYWYR